jgi:hypothetical protein
MLSKFILENQETEIKEEYKSLRAIAKALSLDYFQVRSIYLESFKPKKFLHPITKQLCKKYKVYDNPEIFNH